MNMYIISYVNTQLTQLIFETTIEYEYNDEFYNS